MKPGKTPRPRRRIWIRRVRRRPASWGIPCATNLSREEVGQLTRLYRELGTSGRLRHARSALGRLLTTNNEDLQHYR